MTDTVEKVKADDLSFKRNKLKKKDKPLSNYEQRDYNGFDFTSLYANKGSDTT